MRYCAMLLLAFVGCGKGSGPPSTPGAADPGAEPEADAAPELLLVRPPLVTECIEQSERARFRLASWNIRAARSSSLDAVAARIADIDPDAIALQEVDVGVHRSERADQPALLAERLGYRHAFAASTEYQGGMYGLAVLSRLPFQRVERIELDDEGNYEPRIALDTTLCLGPVPMRFVNHHADIYPSTSARNAREVSAALAADIGSGLMLVGDFNQPPEAEGPRAVADAGLIDLMAGSDASTMAGRRIDYLFADARVARWVQGTAAVVPNDESDHAALYVDVAPLPDP